MLPRVGIGLVLIAVAVTPCLAQAGTPSAEVRLATNFLATGQIFSLAVDLDAGLTGQPLGSYGAVLRWDPAVLQYQSDTGGGEPPFDTAVVNRTDVAAGILRFSDASPLGVPGGINVINVSLRVVADPCLTTTLLDLEFTSLFGAETFEDLLQVLQVQDATPSVTCLFLELRLVDPLNTILHWSATPGALSYDVIRGDVHQIFDDGVSIRLGNVVCLEDDSLDTTTGAGTESANPDMEIPLENEAFFYLVRKHDGLVNSTFGFLSACVRERLVDTGDCP